MCNNVIFLLLKIVYLKKKIDVLLFVLIHNINVNKWLKQ